MDHAFLYKRTSVFQLNKCTAVKVNRPNVPHVRQRDMEISRQERLRADYPFWLVLKNSVESFRKY